MMSAPSATSRFCTTHQHAQTPPADRNTHNRTARQPLRRRRQLVALPVPERRRAARSIPERPIERTGELGRVGHERALVSVAIVDECTLDGLDAAVHHVTRGDAVRAGARV